MSVDFYEEDNVEYRKKVVFNTSKKAKGLAEILMRFGFAKTKRGAQFALITFALIVLVSSVWLVVAGSSYSGQVNPEILRLQAELELEGYSGPELLVALSERLTE